MDKMVNYETKTSPRPEDGEEEEQMHGVEQLDGEAHPRAFFRESAAEHPEIAEEARTAAEFLGKKNKKN